MSIVKASTVNWDAIPTLGVGQCCDHKIDTGDRRLWVCRIDATEYGYPENTVVISEEVLVDGRWELLRGHVPADKVRISDSILP